MQQPQATTLPIRAEHDGDFSDLIVYSVTDTAIAKMSNEYMPLSIAGVDDKDGLLVVRNARKEVKNARVAVEKRRKELKADALAFGRQVDGEAKRITGLLLPIEEHLQAEEDKVKAEKDRIKAEQEAKRQEVLNSRLEKLRELDCMENPAIVEAMTVKKFEEVCAEAEQKQQAKRQAEAEREAAAKAEEERLAKERAELERKQREQEAIEKERQRKEKEEAEKLRAEREAIEKERRAIEVEKAKVEAAEKARIETQERIAREAAEAQAKADEEAKEKARLEALRPDKEKIRAVANDVASVVIPELSAMSPPDVLNSIRREINTAAGRIRDIAENL